MQKPDRATIVLAADTFNLSIFSQLWLVESEVVTRREIIEGQTLVSPVAVSVTTSSYELLIVPERVQLTLRRLDVETPGLVKRIVGKIIGQLPHTPYTAIGVNFIFSVSTENLESLDRVRKLCLAEENPLRSRFEKGDARFGVYMSAESIHDSRLKLDIKPVNRDGDVEAELMQFNYHIDLKTKERGIQIISNVIDKWSDFYQDSQGQCVALHNYMSGSR